MEVRKKLQLCILIYSILLILIVIIINYFETTKDTTYFRWGVPKENEKPLIIISVNIDNYYKYFSLLFLITIIRVIKVGVTEIADPIITFNIYIISIGKIGVFSPFKVICHKFLLSISAVIIFLNPNLRKCSLTILFLSLGMYSPIILFMPSLLAALTIS